MRVPPIFGVYCLLVLLGFSVAKYQGWSLFGSLVPAASGTSGGTRAGGSSGSHK